jgi:hypothetical protein
MRFATISGAFVFFGAGLASVSVVQSQDMFAPATFGEFEISAADDSHVISVEATGDVDATELGGECVGLISEAPTVQLDFVSSDVPLIFSVESDLDTVLAINTAVGDWVCDDDSGGDFNARIELVSPQSGIYDIYVGTYDDLEFGNTSLTISQGNNAAAAVGAVASIPTGVDRSENGELAAGDDARDSGEYQDVYDFEGRTARRSCLICAHRISIPI